MEQETLLFFEGRPNALEVYAALEAQLRSLYPQTGVRVQKTQISLSAPLVYAVASLPRRKADGDALILSFVLPQALDSERLMTVAQPYPGRYMHHMLVRSGQELDDEVMAWLAQAVTFAGRARLRS